MCYDIAYLTKKKTDYAKRYGSEEDVADLMKRLPATFHSNAFQHDEVPVVVGESRKLTTFEWGLIPYWAKSKKDALEIRNKTLNARGETLFEKPSFKKAIATNRCLVVVDGFFESHHVNGKNYPFFISRKDEMPFTLGGVFDHWEDQEEGIVRTTFSIITTEANARLAVIHNNPAVLKRGGPRMPLILPYDLENKWLDSHLHKEDIESMIKPFPDNQLVDFTVAPLRGKNSPGNVKEAVRPYIYPELNTTQQSLF